MIGVYIAWRGRDITVPGLDLFTFWSRKHAGGEVAAQNACLATINELASATRASGKEKQTGPLQYAAVAYLCRSA